MSVFVFLVIMALVAGLVAAGGDWVGHRAARRKIRIAGLRPRHASTLIAVITGVLIALVTYGVVLAIWKDAREALTSYGKVKADLVQTTQELSRKEGQLEESEQRVADADQRVADAESRAAELNDQLSEIRGQIIELTIESDKKRQELERLQKQVDKAELELKQIKKDLKNKTAEYDSEQFRVNGLLSLKDKLGTEIEELEQQVAQMLEGEIIMRRGTYLAYQRVAAGEPGQLSAVVQGALNRVNVNLTRDGLVVDEVSADNAREFIENFPYDTESLIIISTAQNVIEGRPVLLWFEARRLEPLVRSGDTVLEVEVQPGEALVSALGGGAVRIPVPSSFDTDSLVDFSVRLQDRLLTAAAEAGFLPNLRSGDMETPVAALAARAEELQLNQRPYTIRFIANSDLTAIDGLSDCRIEISGEPAQ